MIVLSKFKPFVANCNVILTSNEKLPIKASNTLPEFFQEEFPTFQKFIDIYYQYQSQTKEGYKKISTMKDIDEIGEKYLDAFYKVYAKDLPRFPYIGMADFIRNAKYFYTSRGSEESFRFLFRIMFGIEIDFKYPKENILRSSSGNWVQKVSIYIDVEVGDITEDIVGRKILIKSYDGSTTSLYVKGMKNVQGSLWEIEVEKFVSQPIINGSKFFAYLNPLTLEYGLSGYITQTLNKFEVIDPGQDFLIGEIYNQLTPAGEISFRVTATEDLTRGIKRIEFLSFGDKYDLDYTFTIKSATIRLYSSTVNRYSGYYDDTDGFLSNNSKLQDNFFYQIFSYVIKSKVTRELYEDLVLKLLHPAGLIMFSEFENISNYSFDISTQQDLGKLLDIFDNVNIYDEFKRKIEMYRTFEDSIVFSEKVRLTIYKTFSDMLSMSDEGEVEYWEAGDYAPDYFADRLYTYKTYIQRIF